MSRRGESVYKRKDGRWEARYIHHYEDGVAKYRYLYAHSYWDVKLKRLAEQTEERTARPASRRETALCDVGELWLADTRGAVKESTYARYCRILSCYIYPSLGAKSPANIDQKCARTYVSDLLLKGGRHGQGLSPKTVSDILCVLKSILKYAAAGGYPCADLSLVKAPPHANKVVSVIPKNYVARIEEAILQSGSEAADFCVRIGVLFALYTGLRIGEMCGLRWGDIDLQNRTVSVRRTVERIADLSEDAPHRTRLVIGEPKTESSARTIPLPTFLAEYITSLAPDDAADVYLLTGSEMPTEPHQFYLRYKTFLRRLGIEEYTFHDLRHTFATRCIDAGFDAKSLSEILGHANVKTTLSLYVHPTLEQKRRQMDLLRPSSHS